MHVHNTLASTKQWVTRKVLNIFWKPNSSRYICRTKSCSLISEGFARVLFKNSDEQHQGLERGW